MVRPVVRRDGRPWIAADRWGWPDWSLPVPVEGAHRRAGGRRRYNARRRREREDRRDRLAAMIVETWPALMADHGWQARAARALGVDRATICRDVDVLLADVLGAGGYRLLRALTWTSAERRTLARVGLASD